MSATPLPSARPNSPRVLVTGGANDSGGGADAKLAFK